MKNQRKHCYVRMFISYWNAYLDHKALLVWILNYARLHHPNYKLYGYKSIFFLVKNLNATLFSQKLTSFEWLASIQYSTCKRHGPQPIPTIFCYFIASPSTVSRQTSKIKPIASLWERPQCMDYTTKSQNSSTVSHSNNISHRAQSKESPFDVLPISHIRETHSSCSPY